MEDRVLVSEFKKESVDQGDLYIPHHYSSLKRQWLTMLTTRDIRTRIVGRKGAMSLSTGQGDGTVWKEMANKKWAITTNMKNLNEYLMATRMRSRTLLWMKMGEAEQLVNQLEAIVERHLQTGVSDEECVRVEECLLEQKT